MDNRFRGTGVALVTPFDENNQVDFAALEKILEYVIDGGVNYLVVGGTTGEPSTMSDVESLKVLKFVKKSSQGLPVVLE